MKREEIRQQLEKIMLTMGLIREDLQLRETDHYEDDFGLDSLERVELIMNIEAVFCFGWIPDDEAEKMHTVKDTIDYLEKEIINHKS